MNKIKTIIAHNDNKVVEEIKGYIEKLGYVEVIGKATTGEEVCNQIEKLKPEIVFTKYDMGDMDGMEIIEQSSKQSENKIPIFKFIAKDLSKKITKNTYDREEDDLRTFVKELGKDGIVTVLERYKETIM